MSIPLILGAFWVLTSVVVAMLPMRRQYFPGVALLAMAPILLIWIGCAYGWIWLAFGVFAFVSMFRNPLKYLWRRARGETPVIPK
ncbi:MAG: DUF2484 family protein [Paracoccaceae bacterium]|nr:DUF2484 family protein [Paracoccaceae bacterium]